MFDSDDELFNDGWREPGDDCSRLAFYIIFAIWLIIAVAMVVLGIAGLISPSLATRAIYGPSGNGPIWGWCTFFFVLGSFGIVVVGAFFRSESQHWDLKKMTADRVVAGGFLTGIAIVLLSWRLVASDHVYAQNRSLAHALIIFGGLVLGLAICLASFLVGLFFALLEKFKMRHHTLKRVLIDRRYALDDRLMEHDDYSSPAKDGMTPMVVCRTPEGRRFVLTASPDAYDLANPGAFGSAVLRGKHLDTFHSTGTCRGAEVRKLRSPFGRLMVAPSCILPRKRGRNHVSH